MAHITDCGQNHAKFFCRRCNWDSGWREVEDATAVSKLRRGIPCEGECNR